MPNIVTDYGAVADGQYAVASITMSSGSHSLVSTTALWGPGDVGDDICVGTGKFTQPLNSSITAVSGDGKTATLAAAAPFAISGTHVVCWGTDNAAAFAAFTAANQGATTTLTIPGLCLVLSGNVQLFKGIANLTVNGTGTAGIIGGTFSLGGLGLFQNNLHSSRVASVTAGQSSVTLLTPSEISRFTVGQYALMTGYDLQGLWNAPGGFPSNHHFFEFVLVSAKSSPTVSFSAPLRNSYLSTWPLFNSGSSSEIDAGGPATLYALDASWDTSIVYDNLIFAQDQQTGGVGRSIIFNSNCTSVGPQGVFPSVNKFWSWGGDMSDGSMECDKYVETVSLPGAVVDVVEFQSSSIDDLITNGAVIDSLTGCPKRTTINNSTVNALRPGPTTYGRADELNVTNSVVVMSGMSAIGGVAYVNGNIDDGTITMSGGVIRIPNTYNAQAVAWAVPGTYCRFADNDGLLAQFRIVEVTQDGTYVYIKTSLSGGFPTYNGSLSVANHPAPRCTFRGSSGTAPAGTSDGSQAYGYSFAPAGAPLYAYSRRTYDGSLPLEAAQHPLWGYLTSLSMNVTKAYDVTGVSPNCRIQPLGWFCPVRLANGTSSNYIPTINLKVANNRTLTVANGAQTKSSPQSGDTFADLPEVPLFFSRSIFGNMLDDVHSESAGVRPIITVEMLTDQGISSSVVTSSGGIHAVKNHGHMVIRKH